MARAPKPGPTMDEERALLRAGCRAIAGVDEVGVGAIAGPVVVAAVLLPLDDLDSVERVLQGVKDSKQVWGRNAQIRDEKREPLFELIARTARHFAIEIVEVPEIDALGGDTHGAAASAAKRALANLPVNPDYVLIDGGEAPGGIAVDRCKPIAKGDSTCLSIAAASIVAKVTRDRRMNEVAALYPDYHFEDHKGYNPRTKHVERHVDILERLGPLPGVHHYSNKVIKRLPRGRPDIMVPDHARDVNGSNPTAATSCSGEAGQGGSL